MVCCMYSSELPHWGNSNEYTQHIIIVCKIEKTSLNYRHLFPDLAPWLTLNGSNYPCLQQFFIEVWLYMLNAQIQIIMCIQTFSSVLLPFIANAFYSSIQRLCKWPTKGSDKTVWMSLLYVHALKTLFHMTRLKLHLYKYNLKQDKGTITTIETESRNDIK